VNWREPIFTTKLLVREVTPDHWRQMMVGWPPQVLVRDGTGALAVLVEAGVGLNEVLTLFDTELETEFDTELETELDTDQEVEIEVVQEVEMEVVIETEPEVVTDTVLETVMDTVPEPDPEMEGVLVAAWAQRRHDSRTAKTTKALDIMLVAEI
jgi:hypothetical protein